MKDSLLYKIMVLQEAHGITVVYLLSCPLRSNLSAFIFHILMLILQHLNHHGDVVSFCCLDGTAYIKPVYQRSK